jgi:hypothetical protein
MAHLRLPCHWRATTGSIATTSTRCSLYLLWVVHTAQAARRVACWKLQGSSVVRHLFEPSDKVAVRFYLLPVNEEAYHDENHTLRIPGRLLKPAYAAVKQACGDLTVVGIGGEYGSHCADNIVRALGTAGVDSMDASQDRRFVVK